MNLVLNRCQCLRILFSLVLSIIAWEAVESKETRNAIQDLRVETVLFDKDTLQANVSWKSIGLPDRKLDVRLNPMANEHCSNKPCVVYGLTSKTTDVLLPRDPMPMLEHRECTVEPGCSYEIFVETTDRKIQQTTRYTVPDCVSDICSCKHSHKIPSATINATLDAKKLNIFWNITTTTHDLQTEDILLDAIEIRVGYQNNPSLTWGGRYKNIDEFEYILHDETGKILTSGLHSINLTEVIKNEKNYRLLIRAYVVDHKGCHGKDSNKTIIVEPKKANIVYANSNIVWIFVTCSSVILIVLAIGFVFVLRYMQRRFHKQEIVKNWRGIFHNESPTSGFRPTFSFQENHMYGEDPLLSTSNRIYFENDLMEIPHTSLKFGHNIGKGAFGSVYLAQADNITDKVGSQLVAVKKLKRNSTNTQKDEFQMEIDLMKTIPRHPNIVSLIGYCRKKEPYLMVMEYVGCGDLLNYLRNLRYRHECRSVAINDNGNVIMRPKRKESSQDLIPATMKATTNTNACNNSVNSYIGNETLTSTDTSVTNLSSNTVVRVKELTNGPVGRYLELIHSPLNSSSSATTNSDASYVTRAESIASTKRASETEITYTMFDPINVATSSATVDYVLDSNELHSFAKQIARGMKHLEECKITHRDLAARNILIDENKTLKISDFGLSREGIYVCTKNKKVPVRWLAIEALRDNFYSAKSDVWAFGIVLWEIGTLGGMPYPNVSNSQLLNYLTTGCRMQRPEICSEKLYSLMSKCWLENQDDRPTFAEIVNLLESKEEVPIYVSLDDLAPTYAFPPTVAEINKNDFDEFVDTNVDVFAIFGKTSSNPLDPTKKTDDAVKPVDSNVVKSNNATNTLITTIPELERDKVGVLVTSVSLDAIVTHAKDDTFYQKNHEEPNTEPITI